MDFSSLLNDVATGKVSVADAQQQIQHRGTIDLGFARLDTERAKRCGLGEVVFCPGKTPEHVIKIIAAFKQAGQNVLATRASPELFREVSAVHPDAKYQEAARAIIVELKPRPEPRGLVAVVSAGTADMPVAEEAALVAEWMNAKVARIYDAGVAGLHRLLPHVALLRTARAVIVVAGMEGALPSVVGGLIDRPIIAVPTSIGYGLNFGGLAALLAMLNSCAAGISVVNVDNGFGAGVAAGLINRTGETT
jgi:NCAIR mutase (PurE)-related protein